MKPIDIYEFTLPLTTLECRLIGPHSWITNVEYSFTQGHRTWISRSSFSISRARFGRPVVTRKKRGSEAIVSEFKSPSCASWGGISRRYLSGHRAPVTTIHHSSYRVRNYCRSCTASGIVQSVLSVITYFSHYSLSNFVISNLMNNDKIHLYFLQQRLTF